MEENQTESSSPMVAFINTPKRTVHQNIKTPLQKITETEDNTSVSINPFEVKADSLYFPSCSPSVFATFGKKKGDDGQFRWSIDHVSLLYPADIDETSIPDVWVDPDQEMKAQKAIDTFFAQNSIVPSPWSSDSKNKREIKFRRTVRRSSILNTSSNDVATQTMLTIPPSVDLMALLGSEFVYKDEEESSISSSNSSFSSCRESDVMSTSSLRRKLFVTDEECKTPSRLERKDLNFAKQWSTPTINCHSMQSTPSDLLSSSPITTPIRSESCIIRSSPPMSPIIRSTQKSIRMRSFNERLEEEENSQLMNKAQSQDIHIVSENSMSFYMDTQDTGTFPSYASEKQDTGYVTGSMFSLQNMTTETTSGFPSRITPVSELSDDYGISNAVSYSTNSVSNNNMSIDTETEQLSKCKEVDSVLQGSKGWSLIPNSCSTPAFNL